MFITGGVGAIANDEKFGDDYYLPNDAYLETCAAVGAGFFSQRMNQLTGKGKYIDEFERVLYNGVLTGISLRGTTIRTKIHWSRIVIIDGNGMTAHVVRQCFSKIMGAIPEFIYAASSEGIMINLFIGSEAEIKAGNNKVRLQQVTNYPWEGKVR